MPRREPNRERVVVPQVAAMGRLPRARDRVRGRVLRARHLAAEPSRRGPRRGRPHRRQLRRRGRSRSPRRCPTPTAFDVDQRWQVVALSGEYLVDEEVVVRNRPFEGSSGFEVITPFRLDDGSVFMVDRGWIAQASDGRPSEYAAPPSGHVEIDGAAEGGRGAHRRAHVHRHRVRDDRPRRARRAGGRAELHRRVRRARADRRRRRRAAARRGPAGARRGPAPLVCAPVVRLRPARRSSGSAGPRTRSVADSRRHPEPSPRPARPRGRTRRPKREKADADADLEDEVLDRR